MDDSWGPVMSDTHAERMDHLWAVRRDAGRVLVTGLSLGLVANAMLLREEVESVTVVEIDRDIIMLVAGHWLERFGGRLQVVHADAFSWAPPAPRGRGMFRVRLARHLAQHPLGQLGRDEAAEAALPELGCLAGMLVRGRCEASQPDWILGGKQ